MDPEGRGEQTGWAGPGFDDAAWTTVTVPHTWNVVPEHSNYDGLAWYRRKFIISASARDAHLRLRFDAVFYRATVWLNGERLGTHDGGYTPFEFDVTRHRPSEYRKRDRRTGGQPPGHRPYSRHHGA